MDRNQSAVDQQLKDFRNKYYKDKLLRGALLLVLLSSSLLFVALLSEGWFGFSAGVRTGMVVILGLGFLGVLGYMVLWPLAQLSNLSKTISDFQIAHMVKNHFPEINDKLVNFLQLRKETNANNSLVAAALDRKAADIVPVSLSSAINLKLNNKYLKYLLIPLLLFIGTWLIAPSFLSVSGHRLLNYNKQFLPPAPFGIQLANIPSELVAGQDYELNVQIVDARELPSDLFIYIKNASENTFLDYNLEKISANEFKYTFSDLKEDFKFYIGNPEVESQVYAIDVLKRPFIRQFRAKIYYPAYTGMQAEALEYNIGDFKVIKGSRVIWELEAQGDISEASFVGNNSSKFTYDKKANNFSHTERMMEDMEYFISLTSAENILNIDTVKYEINVLPDRYPSIYIFSPNNDFLIDLDPNMPLELEIADDFGFSKMSLFYRFTKSGGTSKTSAEYKEYPLSISNDILVQSQSYQVDLTSLGLREGDEVEYYIKVWDNDGVSGAKASTSATFNIVYPTLDAKYDEVEEKQDAVKENLEEMQQKTKELEEAYKKMQEKLLEQKRLSFDDKKEMQRMMEEHQQALEQMENTQEQFEEMKEELQENQMISEQTLEKYDELNEYMESMKNTEIEKMLQEMMDRMENLNPEDLKQRLEQLQKNDRNMRQSLERTMELLKQLEVQQKIDEVRNKLDQMKTKQDILNEQLENIDSKKDVEQLNDRQEELNKQMEKLAEDFEDLEKLKDDTKTPDDKTMDGLKEDGEEAQDEMEKASEELEKASEMMQDQEGDKSEGGENNDNKEGENQDGKEGEQESGEEQQGENGESDDQENEGDSKENEGSDGEEKSESKEGENQDEQEGEQESGEEQQGDNQDQSQQGDQQQGQQQQSPQQGGQQQQMPQQQQKNASQSQKNASQKMQEMSDKLGSMQMNMQMQQDQQNLENLRELIENLLKLSFDQEDLRDVVRNLKYGDPSLQEHSQQQKKLQDDMELLSDSLESLANKVFMIKKKVLDESQKITENMERSQIFFRNKQISMIEYHQQTAMTSANNLANMLAEVMQQVQQQMMSAMPGAMCPKPGQNPGSMQKLTKEQQELNQMMQQMRNQGNMSPEKLAEMAARQEAIRQQLKEAHEKVQREGRQMLGDMEKIMQDMKKSETELINKQLTHETLMRQQQILSRLLQADRSVRERDLDNKRQSKTGRVLERKSPEELSKEEYKNRLRQELLKSNKLEYSNDFMILIEQYYKQLEQAKP